MDGEAITMVARAMPIMVMMADDLYLPILQIFGAFTRKTKVPNLLLNCMLYRAMGINTMFSLKIYL
jgi:hypothetical protein